MNFSGILLILLGLIGSSNPVPRPAWILVGAPPVPVVAGEVWLIADRWGAYPGILVATISNGDLHVSEGIQFPAYWEQAFDYRVLVAVSNRPAALVPSMSRDFAYGTSGPPEYLNGFSDIYLSQPLSAQGLGKSWQEALDPGGAITVKRVWKLPEYDYEVWLHNSRNQPIARAHFVACENFDGCGVGCGPLGVPESDGMGVIRFRQQDLREMRSLTAVSAEGQTRDLTDSEMNELLTVHRLHLVW